MKQLGLFYEPPAALPAAWPMRSSMVGVDPNGRVCTDDEIEDTVVDAARHAIDEIRERASGYEGGLKVVQLLGQLNLQALGVAA